MSRYCEPPSCVGTRAFVTWAIRRGAIPRLDYPAALVDRVAGALVVIYAQPLSRISHLTTHDIAINDDRVTITLGPSPIEIPEPLANHVRRPGPTTVRLDTDWLFPSRTAKRDPPRP